MFLSVLLIYTIACFSVIIIPGPTMFVALSNGTTRYLPVIWLGMFGAICADMVLMSAVFLGVGAILMASETLFQILKWVGVVYLAYLAWQLWHTVPDTSAFTKDENIDNKIKQKAFLRAFLVSISNPKGLLFFSAFLPQFIDITAPQFPQYLTLAVITSSINLVVMLCYAVGGFHAAKFLTDKGLKRMNQSCAGVMIILAVFLAAYRKS